MMKYDVVSPFAFDIDIQTLFSPIHSIFSISSSEEIGESVGRLWMNDVDALSFLDLSKRFILCHLSSSPASSACSSHHFSLHLFHQKLGEAACMNLMKFLS